MICSRSQNWNLLLLLLFGIEGGWFWLFLVFFILSIIKIIVQWFTNSICQPVFKFPGWKEYPIQPHTPLPPLVPTVASINQSKHISKAPLGQMRLQKTIRPIGSRPTAPTLNPPHGYDSFEVAYFMWLKCHISECAISGLGVLSVELITSFNNVFLTLAFCSKRRPHCDYSGIGLEQKASVLKTPQRVLTACSL